MLRLVGEKAKLRGFVLLPNVDSTLISSVVSALLKSDYFSVEVTHSKKRGDNFLTHRIAFVVYHNEEDGCPETSLRVTLEPILGALDKKSPYKLKITGHLNGVS